MSRGIIIAAPNSGSGKTTITLALLRALKRRGVVVKSAKAGPDYIDPAYHAAASGDTCTNLDTWAMSTHTQKILIDRLERDSALVVAEGVMGLFDGAPDGAGSAASLARRTGWPVVLVVDASGMAASVAALVHGFASFNPEVRIAGVILNRVGSDKHADLLERSLANSGVKVLGSVLRARELALPDRHLGLVQAREHPNLEQFLEHAADRISASLNVDALIDLADTANAGLTGQLSPLPVLGQHIAIAYDDAFAFCYPYVIDAWQQRGCTVSFFSPLADAIPNANCDAIYLPGGYPELHAGRLATARAFKSAVAECARRNCVIYGECGGYMVMGESLIDADGEAHTMTGLLPLETTFASRKLSLGYRQVELEHDGPLGPHGTVFRGHEFHFASTVRAGACQALFKTFNASLEPLGDNGLRQGNCFGSFIHLVDSVTNHHAR